MSLARIALATLAAGLLLGAGPASALAAGDLQTGIADDRLLLRGDGSAPGVAKQWAGMGIDTVRVYVRWVAVVPAPNAKLMPKGFVGANPRDPGYNWAALDQAVAALHANHIAPILAVTGSGPLWASRNPALGNPRYRPNPRLFGQFASAVAQRYGAAVKQYVVWNEPNIPAWLQPQYTCKGKRCTPASPDIYRELFRHAASAIRREDPDAEVLFGALAPRGGPATSRNAKVRPLAFIRGLGCVTRSGHRDRRGACRTARGIQADGLAYHPHPVLFAPDEPALDPDDAAIADLGHLEQVLDRTTRVGLLKPVTGSRFAIHLTEFGYQTNPPDGRVGVSLARQARWVQQSTFLAWKDPRVKTLVQYEYQDEPLATNATGNPFASWQSGLIFANGKPKPLLQAFPNPFWIDVRHGRAGARFWGQVRPGGPNRVHVQRLIRGRWVTLRDVVTNQFGYWTTVIALHAPGTFRYVYALPRANGKGAETRVSLTQSVTPG